MSEQNLPQSQVGGTGIQQTPYQSTGGQAGFQPTSQQGIQPAPQQQGIQPTSQQGIQPTSQQVTQQPMGQPAVQQPQPSAGPQSSLTVEGPLGTEVTSVPSVAPSTSQTGMVEASQPAAAPAPAIPAGQQAAQPAPAPAASTAGYEESFGPELRSLIGSMNQLANVSEWAESRLTQQGYAAAARACEDVHESADQAKDFILRGSPFSASAVDEFGRVLLGAIQEFQGSAAPEAQEVLRHAQQTAQQLDASRAYLQPGAGGAP